ncbi:MAG: phosphatase domain-containing protein [Thermoanaerobaculia bacterium]
MSSKKMLLFAVLALLSIPAMGTAGAADSFIIVSDVDDTVKVTNVLDHKAAARNAVTSNLVFAGMPELYQNLLGKNSRAERLEFVSGSPKVILTHKVRECLNEARFPAHKLTLRDKVASAYSYKKHVLQTMYGASDNNFLLVGDDTESDPKVYAEFSSEKPKKVLAIYIHQITGRPLPSAKPAIVVFVTAYDIAMHEYKAGRLSEEQAAVVGEAVLHYRDPAAFLPDFQKCPKEYIHPDLPKSLEELRKRIEDRMLGFCSHRRRVDTIGL